MKRRRRQPVGARPPGLVAADLMIPLPASVGPDVSVGEAWTKMHLLDARHLPILDDEDRLVGIVSDRDLRNLPLDQARPPPLDHCTPVRAVMSREILSVLPGVPAREVVELMVGAKIGAVPVVGRDGVLLGIVSYVDILRRLAPLLDCCLVPCGP